MKRILSTVALGLALFASGSAFAYDGYVTGSVYLRAGPDSSYPRVARVRAGTSVVIEGCVDDWSWCDVSSRDDRGWLSARYLRYEYQGHRVLVPRYGVQIGLPIISFVFGSYWDDHYRSRPWYRDRDRYSRVTTRYYRPGGDSHDGSRTYRAPSQAPVESRQSQPSYQSRPSTTTAPPPQRPTTTQERTRTQERTVTPPPRPSVERSATEPKPAPEQQHRVMQQQGTPSAQSPKPITEHRDMTPAKAPPREMPTQSKSPSAQAAGRDKGKDQGAGQDKGKDQGGGKGQDKNKDQGGGKDQGKDKDQGGGKDPH